MLSPHLLTNDELLAIDADSPVVKELQKRLDEALARLDKISQYIGENKITKEYYDKEDKAHTIDSAIYYVTSELERLAEDQPELVEKLATAYKYASIVDTCNTQNEEDQSKYKSELEELAKG